MPENSSLKINNKTNDFSYSIWKIILPLLIFLISFALNYTALKEYSHNDLFDVINPVTDSSGFFYTAKAIADSNFIGSDKFNQEPGYYYFLAVIIKIFGSGIFTIRFFQIIIGALNVVIIYFITLQLFANRRAAVISALLLAFSGVFIYYNLLLLRHFLASFILNLGILIFLKYLHNPSKKNAFFSGIICSAGFFTQPNIISIIFSALFIFIFRKEKKLAAYFAAGAMIIVSLLMIRNFYAGAALLSFSNKGPSEFAAGNTLSVSGVGWVEDRLGNEYVAKYKTLFNVMFHTVTDSISQDPIAYFKLIFRKFIMLLNNYEVPNNYNFVYFQKNLIPFLNVTFINFGIMFVFAVIGLMSIRPALYKPPSPFFFYICNALLFFGSVLAFYVLSRFRFPFFVLLSPFAGYGLLITINETILYFLKFLFGKDINNNLKIYNKSLTAIAAAAAYLITFIYPVTGFDSGYNMALAYANDASAYLTKKKVDKAIDYYKRALKYYPAEAGYSTLIKILLEKNDFETARQFCNEGLLYHPNSPDINYYLAFMAVNNQKYNEIVYYLIKVPDLPNFLTFKFYNLAIAYFYLNDYENSIIYWEKYYKLHPEDQKAGLNIINLKTFLMKKNKK